MKVKLLEIRDSATFLPCFAMENTADNEAQHYLLRRAGYGPGVPLITFGYLDAARGKCFYDPYDWRDRTMKTAHDYISNHWEELKDGDVIDVEFILGNMGAVLPLRHSKRRIRWIGVCYVLGQGRGTHRELCYLQT